MRFLTLFLFAISFVFGYENVEPTDIERLKSEGVVILDIRTESEWQQTGVIPNSQRVTSHDYNGKFDIERFIGELKERGVDNRTKILVVCRSGNRSIDASRALEQNGYGSIYNLKNGIKSYIKTGAPVEKVY